MNSAPLLEALRALLDFDHGYVNQTNERWSALIQQARAAIRLAEGSEEKP